MTKLLIYSWTSYYQFSCRMFFKGHWLAKALLGSHTFLLGTAIEICYNRPCRAPLSSSFHNSGLTYSALQRDACYNTGKHSADTLRFLSSVQVSYWRLQKVKKLGTENVSQHSNTKNYQKVDLSVIFIQCTIVRGELQSFGRGVAMWKESTALDSIRSSKSYTTFTPIFKSIG